MPFKVGVTTGLYTIARAEELATSVKKLGFALTRGTSVIEISGDVPHEITETDGEEIRHMAKKQGLDITFHGSLTVPLDMPERGEWRDAHDHMQKSIRSAVFCGSKYVNFHACLNIWPELMTYAGRKLTMSFCDHEGNFISKILKECEKLRNWFVENRWDVYAGDILTQQERVKVSSRAELDATSWRREEIIRRIRKDIRISEEEKEALIEFIQAREAIPAVFEKKYPSEAKKLERIFDDVRVDAAAKHAELYEKYLKDMIKDKLAKGSEWDTEELRGVVGIVDGAHILAHYVFFTQDMIWTEMIKMYPEVSRKYKLDPSDINSLMRAWEIAEKENDRRFKEFYYGVVGAKMLEGHTKKILEWIEKELIAKEFKGKPELQDIAKKIIITYEMPDARDPMHAGLHILWSPRQLYVAIKAIRSKLKADRVWMLMDYEHIATQGIDPIKEMEEVIKIAPDFGKYVLAVHSNTPNPLHAHEPIEIGDERVYKLLWFLRKTGFGRDKTVYLIFERGGAKDPFQRSVEALRLVAEYLEKDVEPKELPMEFYGMKGPVAGDIKRQMQIIREHAWEPLKDLLEMPEEEWTLLGQTVIKKGKKPELWKKEELK
ncbi:MAG: hypothetical protein QW703_00505 [Candidatus Aenigmatarchaeota archaeon]